MRQASKRIPDSAERQSGIFAEPPGGIICKREDRRRAEGLRGKESIVKRTRFSDAARFPLALRGRAAVAEAGV